MGYIYMQTFNKTTRKNTILMLWKLDKEIYLQVYMVVFVEVVVCGGLRRADFQTKV